MTQTIEIVERGRGPQLSTSRITVQDVVPYLLRDLSYPVVHEIMPTLTEPEFQAIVQYVEENREAVLAQDRRIRERAAARQLPPEEEAAARRAVAERLEAARQKIRGNHRE